MRLLRIIAAIPVACLALLVTAFGLAGFSGGVATGYLGLAFIGLTLGGGALALALAISWTGKSRYARRLALASTIAIPFSYFTILAGRDGFNWQQIISMLPVLVVCSGCYWLTRAVAKTT